ncbi:uncharacterized protein LOC115221491 isoform X1 [Octopus sinensis]|uniref:Uncharacterized protein LOC115221491 isoform X1 n=2 Tax=Octopus sinensis TaxID=2607531 RepID=A0A6P7TB38_9MOLL|nr:uncharacterized protein LOC115221491 isoform X1 [Octopus sinensis]XP_036366953.1 uncharacterized protein LOC115221491 isoform X1 [Octopus sinensis]
MAEEIEEIIEKFDGILLHDESSRELYREKIQRFPNLMGEYFHYTKDHWLSLYKKLENSLSNDTVSGLEDEIHHKNTLVFVQWELNKNIEAERLANEVRETNPDNLLALTNLAFIHLYNKNMNKLKEVMVYLNNLEKREDFQQIEAEGKMNVAYCLRRISFNDYERAILLYKEASNVCPDNYSCLFGVALLQYRCLRKISDEEKKRKISTEAVQYLEKIRCAFPRCIDKILMGKTLALLALFKLRPSRKCNILKNQEFSEKYVQRALHFSPDDRFVLEKCAKFYKTLYKFNKAKELFVKAIEINATAFSHHHLGLTYQKIHIPEFTCFTAKKEFSVEENTLGKLIKCPRTIPELERNEFIGKIEYHFKEALKLSPENAAVLYDLILLYLALKEYENAQECCEQFKTNIKIRDVSFHILYGRLYFILADEENDEDLKREFRDEGTDRFFLAIKSAIEFLPFQKKLKDIWGIKDIMTDVYEHGYIEYNEKLLELIESVEELRDNKELYNKLLVDCDKSELSRKLRSLCKNKQYFKAFLCLRFSEVKPHEVDVKLMKQIYVNLGKHFTETEPDCSKEFFRKCYELCFGFGSETNAKTGLACSKNDIVTNFHYDIYILTSPNSEELAENIGMNLDKYFGLKVTFGNRDYILGKYKTVNLRTILENSCNIGIYLEHSKTISPEFLTHTEYAKQIMEDRQPKIGQIFMIRNHEDIEIPKHLESFPQLKCQSGHRDDIVNIFNFLCSLS